VLIAGAASVNFAAAVPMMAFLTVATLILFVAMRVELTLRSEDAYLFLLLYAVFVVWMVLETIGITQLIA
jgi:cation:H+ antiporter